MNENNWKEEVENYHRRGNTNDLLNFIEIEIIEKLIDEAVEFIGYPRNAEIFKQQLRAKWLPKQ